MKTPTYLLVILLVVHGTSVTGFPTTTAAANKPGTCPRPEPLTLGACNKQCLTDAKCAGNRKCCETSCNGLQCQVPDDKPGTCPAIVDDTTCDPAVHCKSDSKCSGDQKCCPTGCNGFSCQNVV
ncbi:WAP four-disulfide core domain protein 18-like [Mixophyes fleayi]|uniref:WAP four-disulfide core domain protein 18-like n=1 Tax=Mixophyes fleayi TaxID=3061075 RepID=UPI003F4E0F6D